MVKSTGLVASYLCLLVYSIYKFNKSRAEYRYIPLLMSCSISTVLNTSSLVYFELSGDISFFFGLSQNQIKYGSLINLLFLVAWVIGFEAYNRVDTRVRYKKSYNRLKCDLWAHITLLSLSLVCAFIYYYFNPEYGLIVSGAGSPLGAWSGIVYGFKELLLPSSGALLVIIKRKKVGHIIRIDQQKLAKVLYVFIGLDLFYGLFFDLQRGDIVDVFLVVIVVKSVAGELNKRLAMLGGATLLLVILVVSPVIDYTRGVDTRMTGVTEFFSSYNKIYGNGSESLAKSFVTILAQKSYPPASAAVLSESAQNEGFKGFSPYKTTISAIIPRFIWGNKPYPTSIHGGISSTAKYEAASRLGMRGIVVWSHGGGEMYWQFRWIGVLLGGIIVGYFWSWFTHISLTSTNIFLVLTYLYCIDWGVTYIMSIDNIIVKILTSIKTVGPFWFVSFLIYSGISKRLTKKSS